MKLMVMAALAANVAAGPALNGPQMDRALRNYEAMLAGTEQFAQLSAPERAEIIELDRWLHSPERAGRPDTRQQCKERLQSETPSRLEEALLNLKCSQRPAP